MSQSDKDTYGATMTDKERRGSDRRKNQRRYGASMTEKESSAIRKPRKKKSASNQGGASVGGGT